MAQILINIDLPGETVADLKAKFSSESGNKLKAIRRLMNLLRGILAGARKAQVDVLTGAVAASQTFTGSTVVATDTCVIGGVSLVADTDFAVGASDTLTMAALAAEINSNASLLGMVIATVSGAVVTVHSFAAGIIGNEITSTATGGISAGAATLTAGANGTKQVHYFGEPQS